MVKYLGIQRRIYTEVRRKPDDAIARHERGENTHPFQLALDGGKWRAVQTRVRSYLRTQHYTTVVSETGYRTLMVTPTNLLRIVMSALHVSMAIEDTEELFSWNGS